MRMITAWTNDYSELAAITLPNMIRHAGRYGYELKTETYYNLNGSWWERTAFCRKHLPGSGGILMLGVDAAVTNPLFDSRSLFEEIDPATGKPWDMFIAADGNGLNAEVFFLQENEATMWLLEEWAAWEGLASHDQDCLAFILAGMSRPIELIKVTEGWFPLWNQLNFHAYRDNGFYCNPAQHAIAMECFNRSRVRVNIVNQRVLNAYPVEYYGQTRQDWSWHPTDWICHYVARSLEERCRDIPLMIEQSRKVV